MNIINQDQGEIISTPGQFNLIQQPLIVEESAIPEDLESASQASTGGIGGFGTIKCYPELVAGVL